MEKEWDRCWWRGNNRGGEGDMNYYPETVGSDGEDLKNIFIERKHQQQGVNSSWAEIRKKEQEGGKKCSNSWVCFLKCWKASKLLPKTTYWLSIKSVKALNKGVFMETEEIITVLTNVCVGVWARLCTCPTSSHCTVQHIAGQLDNRTTSQQNKCQNKNQSQKFEQ